MHRRNFVKSAAALAGLAAVTHAAASANAAPIGAVIYDERYGDARRFADELARQGARRFTTRSNVARLWYERGSGNIVDDRSQIAGFTSYADLVVVQWIVSAWRFRVLYEGMHDARGSMTLRHRFTSTNGHAALGAALSVPGQDWPRALARALIRTELPGAPPGQASIHGKAQRSNDFPGTLVSWVVGQA